MTLIAAWLRTRGDTRELFLAGDSRLSGGRSWDIAPKILDLGRGDTLIAFAGLTDNAYPLMLQLQNAVRMHPKLKSRAKDIVDLKGYVLNLLNHLWSEFTDLPKNQNKPDPADVRFLLVGHSWKLSEFKIWTLFYSQKEAKFNFRQASRHVKHGGGGKYFSCIGDNSGRATKRVYELLKTRRQLKNQRLDMEPLEVLIEFIRNSEMRTIGGAPQIWKIYAHHNTMPLNVYWPSRADETIAFAGRTLRPFERNSFLVIDPDTFATEVPEWQDPHT